MIEQKIVGGLLLIMGCINIYRILKFKEPFFLFFTFFIKKEKSSFGGTMLYAIFSIIMIGFGVVFLLSKKHILP